jgi:hypothetical protein
MIAPTTFPARRSRVSRALRFARNLARWGIPARSLLFGPLSLGDDLLCTTVLREARRRGTPLAMMTNRPELFAGNSDPTRLLPIDDDYVAGLRRLGARVIQPYYLGADPHDPQRDRLPSRHIAAEMCALAGLRGEVALRPYLNLTAPELASGRRFPRQVVLHSSGLAAAIPYDTKEWGSVRIAAVAAGLAPHARLVQLGSVRDPAIPGTLDLRGRTSLREAAAVLAAADVFVGLEGFLTHLARAVDCPAVVILGGRAPAEIFGYRANTNLTSFPVCAPCSRRTGCPHNMQCMGEISPASVTAAALRWLAQPPSRPLAVDTATVL